MNAELLAHYEAVFNGWSGGVVGELVAEIKRLRGDLEVSHRFDWVYDENNFHVMWRCSCGGWRARAEHATKFHGNGPNFAEDEARAAHAAHVAAILDGTA